MTTINKRTVLAGLYWTMGAVFALTPNSVPFATLLVTVGAYILLEPRLSPMRRSITFKFLLSAE